MAITYPLIIPGSIGPMEANLKKFDAVGEFIGPFDGSAEQQQWPDQHWELDLVWPEMNWAQFAALDAFSGALHGKWGSFVWGPPLAAAPRGSGGAPLAIGVNPPRSNLLVTSGWEPNLFGVLFPGDFLELPGPSGTNLPRLYQYVNPTPLTADSNGNATLDIWPSIREAPGNGTRINLVNPVGVFRLAENRREAPAKRNKTFTFQMKCREAI